MARTSAHSTSSVSTVFGPAPTQAQTPSSANWPASRPIARPCARDAAAAPGSRGMSDPLPSSAMWTTSLSLATNYSGLIAFFSVF